MNLKSFRLFLISSVFLPLMGCVLSTPPHRNSRYSVDITQMKKYDGFGETWVYRHPTKKVSDYKAFMINPVGVYDNTSSKIKDKDRMVYEDLSNSLTAKTMAIMKEDYSVVDFPDEGVLQVDIAVHDIKPIVEMNDADGNAVTRTNTLEKGTKLEIDCYDSTSKEHIFAVSSLYFGENYTAYKDPSLIPNIEKIYEDWFKFFKERLDQAMQKK